MVEKIYKLDEIDNISHWIFSNVKSKVLAFYAPMGAGKTTLIKALVKKLGGIDNVNSPTFGLVNEYQKRNGTLLGYHFDFYRLNDEIEAMDMGFEEYQNTDAWLFMEWPEKIPNLVPEKAQIIKIEILDAHTRKLTLCS